MNWKTACKIAAPAAACAGAFAFLVAPGRATRAQKAPFLCRNYAHRGLHTEDGSVPENSLPAFRAAAEAGYAVEMDVHLTADDRLVVFHDDTLERMCGVQGVIDDFTLAELRALRLGKTDCVIPTFAEALEALGGRVPLLLEVKRGHDNRRLCALTLEALRTYTGPYCVESFDPTIVAWFRRNAPDILRGQLSQPPKEYGTALSKPAAAIVGNSVRHRHRAVKKLKIRFFISFLHQSDWCIHRMHQGDIPLPKFTVLSGLQSPFPPAGRSFG